MSEDQKTELKTTASPLSDAQKWQSLLRGQIINSTVHKFSRLIQLVDQKAQVMILLNSILVPVCIRGFEDPILHYPALISIATACLSIFVSIICIYPKRSHRKSTDPNFNYLHFNDIGHMKREDYLEQFLPLFNDPYKLAEIAVRDIHDTAQKSMIPKYFWIKMAYGIFFVGNLLAVITIAFLL